MTAASASMDIGGDLDRRMAELGRAARAAALALATTPAAAKDRALHAAAAAIRRAEPAILAANAADLATAREGGLSGAMLDRLMLDGPRIAAMARGLEDVAALPDPIGDVMAEWTRPNGLHFARVRVPLGVIGIIFESRPNVTADAAGLCLKSGNAAILRPGSESFRSSGAIMAALHEGLAEAGLPAATAQMVPTADRAAVGIMLGMSGVIDVIVPRGGRGLIERVIAESRVPVIRHLDGNCHVYVDKAADLEMARRIVGNAKLRRTGVCGAAESLLVDRGAAATHLAPIIRDLLDAGCEVRGDAAVQDIDRRVRAAGEADWSTEYLDRVISACIVEGVEGAIAHVNRYGSHHTDAIVTEDEAAAARFLAAVDSAVVLHNASTQFTDGAEFGMGAEIGISTDKLHARGPVGTEQLTSYKYVVRGTGQLRP